MFCKNCGQNLAEGVRFCNNCGTQLSQEVKAVGTNAAMAGLKLKIPSLPSGLNLRIDVNGAVKSPLIFALIFGAAGIVLSLIFSLILGAAWGKPLQDAGQAGQTVWAAIGLSGSFLAVFLRSLGVGYSTNMDVEVTSWDNYIDMTLSLNAGFRIALLLIIPILAIIAARVFTKKSADGQNMPVQPVLNSLWIGFLCAVVSLFASRIKITNIDIDMLFLEVGNVYQSFSFFAAFAWAFIISLTLQFFFDSSAKNGGVRGQGLSEMIGDGIRYGFGPVRQMAVSMGILIFVLAVVALVAEAGEILSEAPFGIIILMLNLIVDIAFKLVCFVFGIPLTFEVNSPDIISSKDGTFAMSAFGLSYGSNQESLPLIAVCVIIIAIVLFLIQYSSIRSSRSQESYWISGGVSLAVHCGVLLLLARFSSTILSFKPPKELVRLESISSKTSTVFWGMQGNFLYMLLIPVAIYLLVGFLCNSESVLSKVCAVLCRFKILLIALLTVLFAVSVYVSAEAVGEGLNHALDLLENMVDMLDRL